MTSAAHGSQYLLSCVSINNDPAWAIEEWNEDENPRCEPIVGMFKGGLFDTREAAEAYAQEWAAGCRERGRREDEHEARLWG